MEVPRELRYTQDHEWVRREEGKLRIGITDYAQDALGDVVFVDLPDPGSHFDVGQVVAEVESTKSVAEVYAPVSGTVVEANGTLADAPELVNRSPYGEGWFLLVEPDDPASVDALLDAEAYAALTA